MVCIKLSKRYWRDASLKNTCCSYKGSRLNSQNPYEGFTTFPNFSAKGPKTLTDLPEQQA